METGMEAFSESVWVCVWRKWRISFWLMWSHGRMRSVPSYPGPQGLQHVCWLVLIQSHCAAHKPVLCSGSARAQNLPFHKESVDFDAYLTRESDIPKKVHNRLSTFGVQEPTYWIPPRDQWSVILSYLIHRRAVKLSILKWAAQTTGPYT